MLLWLRWSAIFSPSAAVLRSPGPDPMVLQVDVLEREHGRFVHAVGGRVITQESASSQRLTGYYK
jgi:hypothetical protein